MINSMTDLPSIAAYLSRIGAEARSLRVAVVKEQHGAYWTDIATIRICKDGTVDAPENYMPTETEAIVIKTEVLAAEWPTNVILGTNYALPPELQAANPEDVFELKDRTGRLIMIQQRISDPKSGEKRYVPWTYWTDNRRRKEEPEGQLPLYGSDKVKDNTTI